MLVTDGEQRSALAVVRSLGRAGYRVHVAARGAKSLAGSSRFTAHRLITPEPLAEPAAYVEAIAKHVAEQGVDVVIPVTEASALAVLADRSALAPARVPMPDLATFQALSDKAALRVRAADAGIAFPSQREVNCAEEARAATALAYPIVLKPSRSVSGGVKMSVKHAANRDELEAHLRALPSAAYPLLLQERIVGPGIGVFVLLWGGERVAAFSHRRLREKPPSGGVSVYAESTPMDAALLERATRLVDPSTWCGVAMVELKLDARTGTPYLMEVNGRFWGSLQLAIDAGVDFPTLLVKRALGEPTLAAPAYRTGLRERWWWGDVDHLLARVRRSNRALSLPPDAPSRGKAILDFFAAHGPDQVFRSDDLRPFLFETTRWVTGR